MALYLVEGYAPGVAAEEIRAGLARLQEGGTGTTRFVSSTFVPEDEAFLCQLEASSPDAVADACSRAGLPYVRIVEAVQLEPRSERP